MKKGLGPAYPYSWPNDARIFLCPSLVFEVWAEGVTPGSRNMPPGFITSNVAVKGRDMRAEKMVEYGARVGMWRLLEILHEEDVPATIIASARNIELYPEIFRACVDLGCEIIGHSYTQDISSYEFDDPEEERANIRKCSELIEEISGSRPIGWLSPRATPSANSFRLLVEEGYLWCGDSPDDELPYVLEDERGPLVIIPYSATAGVNDYDIALVQGNSAAVYLDDFKQSLHCLREESLVYGRPGLLRVGVHAHVFGRPFGRWAFRDAIRYAKSFPDIMIANRGQLAQHILEQHRSNKKDAQAAVAV